MDEDVSMEYHGVVKPIFQHYIDALLKINKELDRIADALEYFIITVEEKEETDWETAYRRARSK